MKKYIFLIITIFMLTRPDAQAQYSASNEYTKVAEKIFSAMMAKDFYAFKTSAEEAGLTIKKQGEEHPFWTQMREHITKLSKSEGWEEIATLPLTDRLFIASFIFYTKTPLYITLTFQNFENQWTLVSFNYKEDFSDYTQEWGFMLDKKPAKTPIKVSKPIPSKKPEIKEDLEPKG